MKIKTLLSFAAAAALLGTLSIITQAQTPTSPTSTPAPIVHHSLFGRHHLGASSGLHNPLAGTIIGNKNSHVYHLPGDTGSLPAEKNRVYFKTEADAQAAGYRRSGQGHVKATGTATHRHGLFGSHMPQNAPPTNSH